MTSRPLPFFWQALESIPGLATVPGEWRRLLRDDAPVAWPFLAATSHRVLTYPCPRPGGDGCPRQVLETDDGFEAVCGETPVRCPSLKLGIEDVVVHALDTIRFGREVGEALGIDHFALSETGIPQTWGLGGFGTVASEAVAVYLTIPTGRDAFRRAVAELFVLADGPFVLLAPTSKLAGLPTVEQIRKKGGAFATLADLVEADAGGVLRARQRLEDLDLERRPKAREAKRPASDRLTPILHREGSVWTIRFAGKSVSVPDGRGVRYLEHLLREPGREFHVSQLVTSDRPELGLMRLSDSGDLLDRKALGSYQAKLADLSSEIEEARRFNDLGRKARLEEELEVIATQLMSATGLGSRTRRATSDAERVRKAVGNAIRRLLATIRRLHPDLGAHLDQAMRLGQFLCYEPSRNLSREL